jgi:hypothetical protein
MIQIWVGQRGRNDKANFFFKVVINQLLNFLYWQFWFKVSLPVKLSGLYVTTDFTI